MNSKTVTAICNFAKCPYTNGGLFRAPSIVPKILPAYGWKPTLYETSCPVCGKIVNVETPRNYEFHLSHDNNRRREYMFI